jgi:LacI family transcriptional regulator
MAAAAALNYSPSALIKAMVTRDTRIVGVIIGDATDPYFATIVGGVEDAARQHLPSFVRPGLFTKIADR